MRFWLIVVILCSAGCGARAQTDKELTDLTDATEKPIQVDPAIRQGPKDNQEQPAESSSNAIYTPKDDKDIKAAIATAQSRLPEFIKRVQNRKPGETFELVVKVQAPNADVFYCWVDVKSYDEQVFSGTYTSVPEHMEKKDMSVKVSKADVADWVISKDDEIEVGNFLAKPLQKYYGQD